MGKILVGGDIETVNGMARQNLARLNANGTLDSNFSPGVADGGGVLAMIVQPNGQILLATYWAGAGITRLNQDGSWDGRINTSGDVRAMALQQDGKIVIGGGFTDGTGIARYHTDLSVDFSFSPVLRTFPGEQTSATELAIQIDGKVVLAGNFTSIDGIARSGFARLNAVRANLPQLLGVKKCAVLTVEGSVGEDYRVEYSTALCPGDWVRLEDLTLSSNPYLFIDRLSPSAPRRFYRVLPLPKP